MAAGRRGRPARCRGLAAGPPPATDQQQQRCCRQRCAGGRRRAGRQQQQRRCAAPERARRRPADRPRRLAHPRQRPHHAASQRRPAPGRRQHPVGRWQSGPAGPQADRRHRQSGRFAGRRPAVGAAGNCRRRAHELVTRHPHRRPADTPGRCHPPGRHHRPGLGPPDPAGQPRRCDAGRRVEHPPGWRGTQLRYAGAPD